MPHPSPATRRPKRRGTVAGAPRKSSRGDALAARLARIGLDDELDRVLHLPLRYEDETRVVTLAGAKDGDTIQIEAIVRDHAVQYRPRRQLVVHVDDANAAPSRDAASDAGLTLRFIHFYGSQVGHFAAGTRLRIRGELRGELRGGGFFATGREMIHPHYTVVQEGAPLPDRLTPVYPSGVGLGQAVLRKAIGKALSTVVLDETVDPERLARLRLPVIDEAIRLIHNPPPDVSQASLASRTHPAWQRVKFDELLAQQLSLAKAHAARRARTAPVLAARGRLVAKFLKQLPFALTPAQKRVVREIERDLRQPHPMQRLLQGDVGSGKTVVAAIAALHAIDAGFQAVLMAPTGILAEQHFRKLAEWVDALGVPIAWLTGSLTKKQKASARDAIESGIARLAIGTHALIQEDVHFDRLGLAIIDEQHRFGVGQRLALRFKARVASPGSSKAGSSKARSSTALRREPHQLMMSATPIPRTLAMTYFADLEVSTIDQLPPGRRPITTKLIEASRRDDVVDRVRHALAEGRQVYWVCPLVQDPDGDDFDVAASTIGARRSRPSRDETLQLQNAIDTRDALAAALPDVEVGLVHGRMSGADKGDVMRGFETGRVGLLVATTVIEVGVDVPNASLMVIEHAERFGLAQLHQLRGRVGRGTADSACILLFQPPLSVTARERLRTMRETQDGFEIARKDLELRGPGEFLGHRQSGEALLRFADLQTDQALVDAARETAVEMLAGDASAVERHLRRWMRGGDELLKA